VGIVGVIDILIPRRAFGTIALELFRGIPDQQFSTDVASAGVVGGPHEDDLGVVSGASLDDAEAELVA